MKKCINFSHLLTPHPLMVSLTVTYRLFYDAFPKIPTNYFLFKNFFPYTVLYIILNMQKKCRK